MKNNKRFYLSSIILVFFFLMFGLLWSSRKLTYLEYKSFNTSNETIICVENNGEVLSQEFEMPYDILYGISIQLGTFARDNNSIWEFTISEVETGEMIYQDEFNASLMQDNGYNMLKLDNKLNVEKGAVYQFVIKAVDVHELSSLAFYVSNSSVINGADFFYNGKELDKDLCFRVYGGDVDKWWSGYIVFLAIFIWAIITRLYIISKNRISVKEDSYIQGMLVAVISFLLLFTFARGGVFIDETDNMYGGMLIANGGVLYRDYVTQHTPVAYYLCGIFAMFGAGSEEQFRLSYYIFVAIVWGLIYIRHESYFGKTKMLLLPILEIICLSSIVAPYGTQILSDGIQGILFVVLSLEYLRYCKDKQLSWDRSIIISICVWGSFGAAFISAYALIWIVLIVVIIECMYWCKNEISLVNIFNRYYKFLISLIVPLILAIVYFKLNHSLRRAFEQFYTFNREVYPVYSGTGDNILEPFIDGIRNFFGIITDNFYSIINATANNISIIQLVIMVFATGILVALLEKRKYLESIAMFLFMVFSATRGYEFHGMAAWYIAVMIIVIYGNIFEKRISKIGKSVFAILAIILLSTYIRAVGANLLYEQPSISEMENTVIALSEEEADNDIFLDAWTSCSLYYFYKERYPVNRAVFMLPWYMDWYEKDNINDLNVRLPKVVVYNEDAVTWGHAHYTIGFANELKKNYRRLGNAGWEYNIWIRNE